MIGDNGAVPTYSDDSLEKMLVTAGVFVDVDAGFEYTIDLSTPDITPDPSSDQNFISLICLKARTLIADGEYRNAARTALSHRDGPASIDTRARADNLKQVAKDSADEYARALESYNFGDGSVGIGIVSPYNANELYH